MSALVSFSTSRFAAVEEPDNPYNPARGHAVLAWLAERLTALGLISAAEVLSEDGGWYLNVEVFAELYMFGCSQQTSGAPTDDAQEWLLVLETRRSLVDRLLGRRELTVDNALLRIAIELLERQPDFLDIELVLE